MHYFLSLIPFDLSVITDDISSLALFLLGCISSIILAALSVYGVALGWGVFSRFFKISVHDSRESDRYEWDEHPLNPKNYPDNDEYDSGT